MSTPSYATSFGTPTQYAPQATSHYLQALPPLPVPPVGPLPALQWPVQQTQRNSLKLAQNPFQGAEDPDGTEPPLGFVPEYRSHEMWKESHVMAITAPFKGKTAEYVIRGSLPFLLSAHAAARSPQWGIVLGTLKLPKEMLMELTTHIDAIWETAASTSPATSYLNRPLFVYGAGSVTCLPNGEDNPISYLRHQGQFQFRGVTSVGEDGVERRSGTQYSDVPCRDHIPGVSLCRRAICRFAHVEGI